MASENSLPSLDGLGQGEWNPAAALHPSLTTASMSSVLSAEYDPFAASIPAKGFASLSTYASLFQPDDTEDKGGGTIRQDARRSGPIGSRSKRKPRKLTTKDEANFQCDVKGCGKLFSRSYNFKAHMEIHDEKREYHFPCQIDACTKKFVRKTDLQRHHQSVHVKERNHKCDYCARLFARKDTLRRHMDDGCSKRFDIGTLDLRAGDEIDDSRTLPPLAMPPSNRGLSDLNPSYSWGR
ncbi:hypothetical protein UCDDA912_g09623 [Diaporthe ampelina]|uniref:C2H2-type domain-containing protein n=1 Tax=Diaporthe ampelina TaxID=1214573 RepID=A0A0G2F8A9_9PEZI|nr:hypothetical protein UCDDA912_g09623 [Diaporthe ampelina]